MENEREKGREQTEGSGQQQPIGQDSQSPEQGAAGQQPQGSDRQDESISGGTLGQGQSGGFGNQVSGSPQGSTGNEFGQRKGDSAFGETAVSGGGQSDLGTQADTTLAGRADQQDLGQDQPGSSPTAGLQGTSGASEGEGFIGAEGTGSDEYLQERGSPQSGFAEQGQGAPQSDVERDRERSENRDSDIEGGSGNV